VSRTTRGIALVLLLLTALVASAPARLLGLLVPADQVVMQGFSGTLWQGSVGRCLLRTGAGYLHLGRVNWQLRPLSLLLFAPRLQLESSWGSQRLQGELVLHDAQDIDLYRLEASVPADLLRHFVPVALAGTLEAQVARLSLRSGLPREGEGRLIWRDGVWLAPRGPLALGSYAVDFMQPQGEPLAAQVVTLAGPLRASGSAQLEDRRYAVDVLLESDTPLDEQLQQALSLIARPVTGGYRLRLDGELAQGGAL